MIRRLHIVPKAKPARTASVTSIQLSFAHRLALMQLQTQRMVHGERKPTVSEMVAEALELLFKKEGIKNE
jgi:hypothetical protein